MTRFEQLLTQSCLNSMLKCWRGMLQSMEDTDINVFEKWKKKISHLWKLTNRSCSRNAKSVGCRHATRGHKEDYQRYDDPKYLIWCVHEWSGPCTLFCGRLLVQLKSGPGQVLCGGKFQFKNSLKFTRMASEKWLHYYRWRWFAANSIVVRNADTVPRQHQLQHQLVPCRREQPQTPMWLVV